MPALGIFGNIGSVIGAGGLALPGVIAEMPYVGEIRMLCSLGISIPNIPTPPIGWLVCDGSYLGFNGQYRSLGRLCAEKYGAYIAPNTDGHQFALPHFGSRIPLGAGTGTNLTARTVGGAGGVETVTLDTTQIPAHTHPATGATAFVESGVGTEYVHAAGDKGTLNANTEPTGGGLAHANMPPYLTVYFIINWDGQVF